MSGSERLEEKSQNEGVNRLYSFICDHPGKRISEISKVLNVPQKTIERWIHKLKAEQKITFVGSPKTGGYEKNQNDKRSGVTERSAHRLLKFDVAKKEAIDMAIRLM